MSSTTIPKQKISYAAKKKKDFQWGKDTVKAWISRINFNTKRKQELYELYDLYNGKINLADYTYVSDPYKSKNGTARRFPAEIRSYNIIKPVVDLLVGERSQRPFNYQVVVKNGDVKNKFEEYRTQQYLTYLEQSFVNNVNAQGADTGLPSKELPESEEFVKQVKTNYRDKRAIMGQQAMDYIVEKVELNDKLQTAFFDWIVTGEVYSYKGVLFNEVEYDIVSAVDIFYEMSKSCRFVEDGDMAGQRRLLSVNEVVDIFRDDLTPDEIDQLERPASKARDGFNLPFLMQNGSDTRQDMNTDREVEVYHVTWKSFAEIGFLDTVDPDTGQPVTLEVSRDYKPLEGEDIEWIWVSEGWEGYQIDETIFKNIGPIEPQRNALSNKSSCKLPYNGRVYSDRNSNNISVVEMGKNYQKLYNVFHFRLELSIAKNKDKITLMEINTIPKKHGWDEEKFMYTADALGFAFIDSTAVGQNKERVNFNQFQVLDMSLGQYIGAQFQLLQSVKGEWEEFLGISRQRKGQIMASDGAANSQMAVGQSNVMTNELFRKFSTFEQRDMQGLLDNSKTAWKDGKSESYITSDFRNEIIDIGPDDIREADLGLFIKNSTMEDEKLKALKGHALEFAQNGAKPSTVAEILDSTNFSAIKEKVKEVEQAKDAYDAKVAKAEGDQQQQMEALRQQALDGARKFDMTKLDKEITSTEKMHDEKMDVEWAKLGQEDPPTDNSIEYEKLNQKDREIASKERIENKKIASQPKAPKK